MERIEFLHRGLLAIAEVTLTDTVSRETAFRRITEDAARLLDVDRVRIWLRDGDSDAFLPDVFCDRRGDAVTDTARPIRVADYPELFAEVDRLRTVAVDDTATDPRTARLCRSGALPDGVTAVLCAPIRRGAELLGAICFSQLRTPRPWGAAEQSFAVSMADLVAAAIHTAKQAATERELRRAVSELERHKYALDCHAIISVAEPDGRISYVNDRFCEISGYGRDEVIGQDHRLLKSGHHPQEFFADMWRTITAGEVWRGEVRNRAKDGSLYCVETTIVPFVDGDGRIDRYTAIHTEITAIVEAEATMRRQVESKVGELERVQKQLLQSEKLASIGQLAAGVAHEINNPVGYINSNIGTLAQYVDDVFALLALYGELEAEVPAESPVLARLREARGRTDLAFVRQDTADLVRESQEGVARVRQIVEDLKDFSRVREMTWELADLHRGLDSTLNIVHNELKYKAEVVKEYGDLPLVECVPAQLNQVFLNLLVNAAHAITTGHGTITVRTAAHGEWVSVQIADSGCGIAPDHLGKLFDPFFTTKPVGQGTGLGLSVSYGIVQKHSGRIEVESRVGQGSTFTVWLPQARRAETPDTERPAETPDA